MKIQFERTRFPSGEFALGAALVAFGLLGAAWLRLGLPTPVCQFHSLTGLPCITCGGTRCLRHLFSGDIATAISWNPLVFFGAILAGLFAVYLVAASVLGWPRLRIREVTGADLRIFRAALAGIVLVNWIYLLLRFSGGA